MEKHRQPKMAQCAFIPSPQDRRKLEPRVTKCLLCFGVQKDSPSWTFFLPEQNENKKLRFLEIYAQDLQVHIVTSSVLGAIFREDKQKKFILGKKHTHTAKL